MVFGSHRGSPLGFFGFFGYFQCFLVVYLWKAGPRPLGCITHRLGPVPTVYRSTHGAENAIPKWNVIANGSMCACLHITHIMCVSKEKEGTDRGPFRSRKGAQDPRKGGPGPQEGGPGPQEGGPGLQEGGPGPQEGGPGP